METEERQKLQRAVALGALADELLHSPAYHTLMAELESDAFQKLKTIPAYQQEEVTRLHVYLWAVSNLQEKLSEWSTGGQSAAKTLDIDARDEILGD